MTPAKILIIDDSPEDTEQLIHLLGPQSPEFEFVLARTGAEGLEVVEEQTPDCVLLDYKLDHENGLDLLPVILGKNADCSIVMLTGQGSEKIAAAAIKAGASDYLIKQEATATDVRTAIGHAVERAQMRRQLAAQEHDLRRQGRLEALGELSAGIAHDFNNMLATIRFGVEAMKRVPAPESAQKKLEIVLKTVDRASERTQGLLSFASKQVGRLSNQMCSSVLDEIEALTRDPVSSSCAISFETCQPDEPVYCDHALLQNALLNLIVNARDAIVEAGTNGLIKVSARTVGARSKRPRIEFSVKDNGGGIPAALLERVTDPYFTTKRNAGGTGIGLSMVHGFAKQNGSRLQIQSDPSGTDVRFELPIGEIERSAPELTTAVETSRPERPRTVLLVEDEFLLAMMIEDELKEAGFDVLTAGNGETALACLEQMTPEDAVVTDISLGGTMDGFDLAAKIRQIFPDIQIIGVSGFHEFDRKKNVKVMTSMLTKPFDPSALPAALNAFAKARAKG